MKDDQEFNIKFVSVVEKYPCLYDYTCKDYSKKYVVNNSWERIAEEISESVQDCKDRWKNLRACFTRHLKSVTCAPSGSETKSKRPYYLAEYLHFLQPFTKSRKSKGIYEAPTQTISSPEDTQPTEYEINYSEEELHDPVPQPDASNSVGHSVPQIEDFRTPVLKKKPKLNFKKIDVSQAEVNKLAYDYFQAKSSIKEKKPENPDLDFLKSILPDMNEMSNNQKRRFKIGVLNLAEQILSENTPVSSV